MAATSPAAATAAPVGGAPPGLQTAIGNLDIHQGIARDIGAQVETMILEAKAKSESTVSKEVTKIKVKMEAMAKKIKTIKDRVDKMDSNNGSILKSDLQKSIAKLEEVWEGEVGTLKHELWQTIQAHNHNADLLKHHKQAIDHIHGRAAESVPNPELEHIHAKMVEAEKVLLSKKEDQQQLEQQ